MGRERVSVAAVIRNTRKVLVYNLESGECVMTVGSEQGVGDGQFCFPFGVAFTESGLLCVSDHNRHDIQVFDQGGAFVLRFGVSRKEDGQFNCPSGLALTPEGDLLVADMLNNRAAV